MYPQTKAFVSVMLTPIFISRVAEKRSEQKSRNVPAEQQQTKQLFYLELYALHPDPVINHYSCSRSVSSEIRTLVFLFTSFQTSRILRQEVQKFYECRNCRFHFLFEHANILRHARSMQVTTAECCLFLHHLYISLLLEIFFVQLEI